MVAKDLLEILVCPACGDDTPVTPDEADQTLVCGRCGRRYPVRDGVPVMLVDEAVQPPGAGAAPGPDGTAQRHVRSP